MSEEHEDYGQKHTFSSGIKVVILPFPSMRLDKFIKNAKKKFPLPKPPKKTIKVAGNDGDNKETIPNLKDGKYLEKLKDAQEKQDNWLNEKILRTCLRDCVELDISLYEDRIAALEEDNDELYPENLLERKVEFLIDYVIRSAFDFLTLVKTATGLSRIGENEVSEQLKTFSSDVE